MYQQAQATVNYPQEQFTATAQGELFTIQLSQLLPRQQTHSCADDHSAYVDLKVLAGHHTAILCKVANTVSPTLPYALYSEKHFRDVVIGGLHHASKRIGRRRGVITEFSRRSRSRLLRVGARLCADASGLLLTMTYRENMRDHALAKQHLIKLSKWLQYHYPLAALLWRLEYQTRGAIHFHILALNISYVDAVALTEYWQKMTGDNSYPDVKPVRSRRKVMSYISKYIAKLEQAECVVSGFISQPYLENFTGRFWGVINRKAMPYAKLDRMVVSGSKEVLMQMRRYARRKWRGMSKRIQGFTLFVDDSSRWMELLRYEIMRT